MLVEANSQSQTYAKMSDQVLDHTIFLVGWKVEEKSKMPVWIVRNSYGDHWGMRGDFYVRMGHDDFGVESEISGYDVEYLL